MGSIEPVVNQMGGLLNWLPMDELGQLGHLYLLGFFSWSLVHPALDLLFLGIGHQCPPGPHGSFWIGSRYWVPGPT